jgi:hypothetical protein
LLVGLLVYSTSLLDIAAARSHDAPDTSCRASACRYLFLLSHMRSYSSLLSHVLGSSAEIDGYGETHIKYKHRIDLWRLRRDVRRSIDGRLTGRIVLDKILHNNIRAPDLLIAEHCVHALIFLRQPESALRSIITLAQVINPGAGLGDPHSACDYYVSRLHRLRADGERLGQRALYFDAERIVNEPVLLLRGIQRWLQLERPLRPVYQVSKRTGEEGFGDPLHNIHAGRILSASQSTLDGSLCIPSSVMDEAQAAYRRCRESLLVSCEQLTG